MVSVDNVEWWAFGNRVIEGSQNAVQGDFVNEAHTTLKF